MVAVDVDVNQEKNNVYWHNNWHYYKFSSSSPHLWSRIYKQNLRIGPIVQNEFGIHFIFILNKLITWSYDTPSTSVSHRTQVVKF